jgi:hypothetical protein
MSTQNKTLAEWRTIAGFPEYEISNHGSVRDKIRRCTIKSHNRSGYRNLNLRTNGKYTTRDVHVLMARAFIPNPYNLPAVDHINRVRNDNRLENLRWVTEAENQYNRSNTRGYGFHKASGKFASRIVLNGKKYYLGIYDTEDDAHQAYLAAKSIYHVFGRTQPKIVVKVTLKQ